MHTLHPHLPTPFTLFLASPASIQPCSRSTCVHHGDKAKRKRERERESVRTVCNLCCCSLFLSSFGLPLLSLHRPWQGGSHSDLFGLRKTGSQQTSFFFFCRGQRDGRMNGGTEGWIAESRDFLQCPWLSLSHALCWYSGFHYPLICISQMQHSVINKSSNYGSLSSVTVIMRPFVFVII